MIVISNLVTIGFLLSLGSAVALKAGSKSSSIERRVTVLEGALRNQITELRHGMNVINDGKFCRVELPKEFLTIRHNEEATSLTWTSTSTGYIDFNYKASGNVILEYQLTNGEGADNVMIEGRKDDVEKAFGMLNPFHDAADEVKEYFTKYSREKACEMSVEKLQESPSQKRDRGLDWIDKFLRNEKDEHYNLMIIDNNDVDVDE
ncbi:hypothetical protein FOL47_007978 [Perkinsus chesapeaki]|uniref:Uncharacterized protein n=1 Tax=Perkinsus chesapeaki TaxID=330153 RepID=A0A7J6LGK0_PERCH|nr:hypothetical protein FOL47_007978 [Perkinsus chesapeaki]